MSGVSAGRSHIIKQLHTIRDVKALQKMATFSFICKENNNNSNNKNNNNNKPVNSFKHIFLQTKCYFSVVGNSV